MADGSRNTNYSMLPEAAYKLIQSTRYLHLATSYNDVPHVSLMNFTYYRNDDNDYIIISTPKNTTKYENMVKNNKVSILIHDWISDEIETVDQHSTARRNSLFELITNMNKNELRSVSVMINGECQVVQPQDPKYELLKSLHLNNAKFDDKQIDNYINTEDNELILISITNCKTTDTDNHIQEY